MAVRITKATELGNKGADSIKNLDYMISAVRYIYITIFIKRYGICLRKLAKPVRMRRAVKFRDFDTGSTVQGHIVSLGHSNITIRCYSKAYGHTRSRYPLNQPAVSIKLEHPLTARIGQIVITNRIHGNPDRGHHISIFWGQN